MNKEFVSFLASSEILLPSTTFKVSLGLIELRAEWIMGAFSIGVK
jgi:hypothetical protein